MKVGFEESPLYPGCYRLGVKREIIMEDGRRVKTAHLIPSLVWALETLGKKCFWIW